MTLITYEQFLEYRERRIGVAAERAREQARSMASQDLAAAAAAHAAASPLTPPRETDPAVGLE
jgi:hypothetical protein